MRNRSAGLPRVVITLTDGLSNREKNQTKVEADRLKIREINMISIGIGKGKSDNFF